LPTVKAITDLIGNQTPKDFNGGDYSIHFMVPVYHNGVSDFQMRRVLVKTARSYYSLEEILGDQTLIPLNSKAYDIKTLQKHLAMDSRRGFGIEFSEHGIVAYAGISPYDKPIAVINEPNGTVRYFASPIISNLIKRI
jgi:hypothetical protein